MEVATLILFGGTYIYIKLAKKSKKYKKNMVSVMTSRSCIELFHKQGNFCKETKQQEYPLATERRFASKSDGIQAK